MAPDDDLSAPLGQDKPAKRRLRIPVTPMQAIVGCLGAATGFFLLWAVIADDPLGGEPTAIVSAEPTSHKADTAMTAANANPLAANAAPAQPAAAAAKPPAGTHTINIIDGSSGARQEVIIAGPEKRSFADPLLQENSRHGPIPKIGPDGRRPAEAYAGKESDAETLDGPRIALVIGGLGIGASTTADALAKMPGAVTLALAPYGTDLEHIAARAREQGHEILLQVPMEPVDYPDNDPGPQTLLTSISTDQNLDRLQWLMSRAQGYVGIANLAGARFSASEQAIAPVMREVAKRGLVYLDDGSSPRSLTSQIAGANNVPFVKAEVTVDAVPTPAEVDKALARLESLARERGVAIGYASALPVTIDRVSKWAKAVQMRGFRLVPVTALALKPRSS